MHVLMTSTSYPRDASDWRGIFIRNVAAAIARSSDMELDLWSPPGELPDGVRSAVNATETAWLRRLMDHGGIAHLLRKHKVRSVIVVGRLLRALRRVYVQAQCDLYHINWLQCAMPLPANRKPALITVLGNDMKLLRLPMMQRMLRRAIRGRAVAICPNADWMVAPLRAAFGDLAEVTPVPFGIDPCWYRIRRDPAPVACWLVVTRLTADKLGSLFEWSEPLFRDAPRELHLFGPMQENVAVPAWVRYHGATTPEQLATQWFPHAQGLVTLSRHAEGRPQVMLEAMAAGLPIIASRMPAHADMVADGVTGKLCASADEYAQAVAGLEDADTNRRMGAAARERISREFGTWDDCASRYVSIYQRLLGVREHG
ncbi:MAG: glycosyltransferase family 4 protein [Proteobacteria bacterium]|nr:glycosyltransferase family 4 protein [Pseudomonadota bacterium]